MKQIPGSNMLPAFLNFFFLLLLYLSSRVSLSRAKKREMGGRIKIEKKEATVLFTPHALESYRTVLEVIN